MAIDEIHAKVNGIMLLQGINGKRESYDRAVNFSIPTMTDDVLDISGKSLEFLGIRKLVQKQPEVRIDKVNKLAQEIDTGNYKVNSMQIADALIRKNFIEIAT